MAAVDGWGMPSDTKDSGWGKPSEESSGDPGGNTSANTSGDAWGISDSAAKEGGNYGVSNGHNDYGASTDNKDGGYGARGCFNCGQEGHSKADCPNPRVFSGQCNLCGKEGHMRKDCPDKPPVVCRHCGEEGHIGSECQNRRKIDRSHVPDVDPEEAWKELVTAISERDIDDVKDALAKYFKHFPAMTYIHLHNSLRSANLNLWLIATQRELLHTYTNMDLQGNVGKTYTVSYRFSDKPERPREAAGWPATIEEMVARLEDAGEAVDSGARQCHNCNQIGHSAKDCPEEKQQRDRVVIMCYNCNETGHRIRDCPTPRVDKFACKNCNQPGHKAADCTEPRSTKNVECRKCNEMGHFSRDCPTAGPRGCRNCGQEGHMARECTEPKNMANMQCRNCDEMGHMSKECPKPRDWSRVTCSNCGQTGHTKVKCREPPKEDAGFEPFEEPSGATADASGGFDSGTFDKSAGAEAPDTTEAAGGWGVSATTDTAWGTAAATSSW